MIKLQNSHAVKTRFLRFKNGTVQIIRRHFLDGKTYGLSRGFEATVPSRSITFTAAARE